MCIAINLADPVYTFICSLVLSTNALGLYKMRLVYTKKGSFLVSDV